MKEQLSSFTTKNEPNEGGNGVVVRAVVVRAVVMGVIGVCRKQAEKINEEGHHKL